MGKLRVKFLSIQFGPLLVAEMEKLSKFTESSTKTDEIPFRKFLARQAFHMSVNYKGALEHVVDVHEVCVSVAY
jgi:hypothetical protein